MADPYVRVVGYVHEDGGHLVPVGVDYDTVTIGGHRFGSAAAEELARLFVGACWEAAHQRGQLAARDWATEPEPLKVKYAPGRKVRYAHPDSGYPGDRMDAARELALGHVYTITHCDIGQACTWLTLAGVRSTHNSVLFDVVPESGCPADCGGQVHDQACREQAGDNP